MTVSDERSTLMERIDLVCRQRGLTHKAWSRAAGFAANYLATTVRRARENPDYVLPEDAAIALARVAQVSSEWLRRGTGSPEIVDVAPRPAPPDAILPTHDLGYAVLEAWRRTDFEPAVIIALQRLIGAGRAYLPREREEAILLATRWLRATARLLRENRDVTWENIAGATALGGSE